MTTTKHILDDIPDSKPVRVFLPLKNGGERYRIQGIYQKSASPVFSLLFKPGSLPKENIDVTTPCIINIDMGGPSISLEANISKIVNSQQIILTAIKSMSHEQMREFFRVDTVTGVIGRSFLPEAKANTGKEWVLRGETIDISGSGILAIFSEKPPQDKYIRLEITLPTDIPEVVSVLARPIRTVKTTDNQYDVAYHFEEITTEDRDKIIGCCLEIQRKLLRLKVNVKDL
jgi:hypothetical protein